MPSVLIAGGGLAGLSAAAALAGAGCQVQLFEARPFLGGRATSFPVSPADENSEMIDNCQHVLLRCCVNLLDFYQRLGVRDRIRFYDEFYFVEPGGRVSSMHRGSMPAPLHFTESFVRMHCFGPRDKFAIARGLVALNRERTRRQDLHRITMLDWLLQKHQTPAAIERFWRQVLVSAINEDLDRMAAAHGFQVFWLGFLARPDSYQMGIPAVPLRELYAPGALERLGVSIRLRSPIECMGPDGISAGGERHTADYYVSAMPFERLAVEGVNAPAFEHSPITGIHLWFDRPVTDLPHATLLDRTIQWMFNKSQGRYVQLVVSASRELAGHGRNEIVDLALGELAEFFPAARGARLERAHVIKEMRATYSAAPETEALRPGTQTRWENVFLAGDWTRSGWPATMEGAVRSGYAAAEAVLAAAGRPQRILLPDVA